MHVIDLSVFLLFVLHDTCILNDFLHAISFSYCMHIVYIDLIFSLF